MICPETMCPSTNFLGPLVPKTNRPRSTTSLEGGEGRLEGRGGVGGGEENDMHDIYCKGGSVCGRVKLSILKSSLIQNYVLSH